MRSYSLAQLAQRAPGTVARLPLLQESSALERSYLAELRRMLRACARVIRDTVIREYERDVSLTVDVGESTFEQMRRLMAALAQAASTTVRQLLEAEAVRHTDRFAQSVRRALSVSVTGIIRAEDLSDYIEQAALRNAGLITGITDDLARRVQSVTTTSLMEGRTVRDLQSRIRAELNVMDSRARLIARDQTAKLNSEMNERRHRQAGVERYVWRTSQDERVRARHRGLEGQEYEYGEYTGAEEGLPPGRPIQCRCVAQAVVEF